MDSKGKRLLTIAAIVILLFLGITAYFIFSNKGSKTQVIDVDKNLVPFGQQSGKQNGVQVVGDESQTPISELVANQVPVSSRARLRKITSFPISGFGSFTTIKNKSETIIDPKTQKEKIILTPVTINHIRYNDQRTGHMFDGIMEDDSILNTKLTKTNLPSAEELVFNKNGSIGFLRYEKNNSIETFKLIIPPPPTLPSYCQYTTYSTDLTLKSKGVDVQNLQYYINAKLGQNNKIDGSFGKKTADNVKQIQKNLSVNETGILDEVTKTAISAECVALSQKINDVSNNPVELKGSLVSGYITQAVKNLNDNTLFFLQKDGLRTKGYVQSFDNPSTQQVFDSSFNEWMPQFVNKNLVTMTTYATGKVGGYMYGLDPIEKTFSKLIGPSAGLTTLTSPDGTRVLVTAIEGGQLITKIVFLSSGKQKIVPFTTFPEKCSWYSNDQLFCGIPNTIPVALYPDAWYQGTIGFSDTLWSYTLSDNQLLQVATPKELVDIFRVESYPSTGYIYFMNK
jgi:peptidoglycan hydrolase-like protein with peptidoglycan-binding domain